MKYYQKFSVLFFSLVLSCWLSDNIVKAEELPLTDTTAPIISLVGSATVSINLGEVYVDNGASANDDVDGDISTNIIVTNLVNTSAAGEYTVTYNVSDAAGNNALAVIRNVIVVESSPVINENFVIRNGEKIIWQGSVALAPPGTISINDSNGQAHLVNSRSVLGLLYLADQSSESFSISNLQYFSSFGSFYLKCITPLGEAELCDNWQYSVGSSTPNQSIDSTILSSDQTIGIFFGSPHRLVIETQSIEVNTPFFVKAENYNYIDNTWGSLINVSIGITLPNPEDPWTPIVVSTKPVDALGKASFILSDVNDYSLGIVEDFYYPTYQLKTYLRATGGVDPLVQEKQPKKVFNTDAAISFLKKNQKTNGSFLDSELYSDWAGMALGSAELKDSSVDSLLSYLKNTKPSFSLTDNERRTMALLSLKQNPYEFNNTNYVQLIINGFDGEQFGDKNLINDDVFAIIPLLKCGYEISDPIIQKTSDYILSKQQDNGSWNNSLDLTAATIQALSLIESEKNIKAITSAEKYILEQQKDDGGLSSVYSTSWAEQARLSLNKDWTKNNNTLLDYLANQQADDGGMLLKSDDEASRIWATSYALPAALGKNWFSILKEVEKPKIIEPISIIEEKLEEILIKPALAEEVFEEKNNQEEKPFLLKKDFIKAGLAKDEPKKDLEPIIENKPINNQQESKADNKNLIIFTSLFIIIGGIVVYRFWV